jgi:predicted nuclease with TOPRIM domain
MNNTATDNNESSAASELKAEVLELRAKIAELENRMAHDDMSTLMHMVMGTVNQLKADMVNNALTQMGQEPQNMYNNEVGTPGMTLPPAEFDYQVLQRKSDDSIAFDWVRAH